ncbi:MAG: efflux RND transporter permease subunit, partial [Bauldia sp.]|nr:efflux RND transporter permease subunit [Bauldia sp.]
MRRIVDIAVSHARLTIAVLIFLLLAGASAYVSIPKESTPDVQIPLIYVSLSERGISPEDAERLLLRPIETALKTVGNVKTMRSAAFEGGGYVLLEFDAGFNSDVALADVRAKVDGAKTNLPADANEPGVHEVNLSLFPVVSIALTGDISERTLGRIARDAQNAIEQAPGVLSADLRGTRDEVVEIIAEPMLLKSYGVSLDQFAFAASQGNSLVAAGALEGPQGRFAVKVPALIETPEDVLNIPVAASNAASVKLGDVATILPTFKDAISITRVNGRPAVVIDVSKRSGANLINTVDEVKKVVAGLQKGWPESVNVQFIGDQSKFIKSMLGDLQNSVITAILLVAVVILFVLGGRASIFIGIALPFAFLTGVLGLNM